MFDETRKRKKDKNKDIIRDAEKWFKSNEEEIKIKHRVQRVSALQIHYYFEFRNSSKEN
jgi:hypothetical protein